MGGAVLCVVATLQKFHTTTAQHKKSENTAVPFITQKILHYFFVLYTLEIIEGDNQSIFTIITIFAAAVIVVVFDIMLNLYAYSIGYDFFIFFI